MSMALFIGDIFTSEHLLGVGGSIYWRIYFKDNVKLTLVQRSYKPHIGIWLRISKNARQLVSWFVYFLTKRNHNSSWSSFVWSVFTFKRFHLKVFLHKRERAASDFSFITCYAWGGWGLYKTEVCLGAGVCDCVCWIRCYSTGCAAE